MKAIGAVVLFITLLASSSRIGNSSLPDETGGLAFEGTVLRIGPHMPMSGGCAFYRLAKYRVDRVCSGRYFEPEIVVDNLVLTGKELDELSEGDRVWVTVTKSKEIFSRMNIEGIREESDKVDIFYEGGTVSKTPLLWWPRSSS